MKQFTLPNEARAELRKLVAAAANEPSKTVAVETLIRRVSALPPKAIFEVEDLVGHLPRAPATTPRTRWFRTAAWNTPIEPTHAPVLMMNKSGYVREAALSTLAQLPDTPFFVAALVWRLNDWVQPVRRVAEACAERLLPRTSAQAIGAAAPFLLERISTWRRWQSPPDIVVNTIGRPECVAELVAQFARSAEASAGALRAAMRMALFDNHFLTLSQTAVRPEFRAALLMAMLDGEVTWVERYERQWVDKRYGVTRRVPVLGRRQFQRQSPIDALIRQGARDRSTLVRRVAASGLVKHAPGLADVERLIALFAADKSPAVRSRMDYLERRG